MLLRATRRCATIQGRIFYTPRYALFGHACKAGGSVVEPSRLRFDFTHYTALDPDELAEVERLMNEQISRIVK